MTPVPASLLLAILAMAGSRGCCDRHLVEEVASPDGAWIARTNEVNCGTTDSGSLEVHLRRNVWFARDHLVCLSRPSTVGIDWSGDVLTVTTPHRTDWTETKRWIVCNDKVGPVEIRYQHLLYAPGAGVIGLVPYDPSRVTSPR